MMIRSLLLRLLGRHIHGIIARILSDAYNSQVIRSDAYHLLSHQSGHVCMRPGYDKAAFPPCAIGRPRSW